MTETKELTNIGDTSYLSKLTDGKDELLDEMSSSTKSMSFIKPLNGFFYLLLSKENKEEIGRHLNVIILGVNGKPRGYFEEDYMPGKTTLPCCHSVNGIKPDSTILNPCAKKCGDCEKSIKGSGKSFTGKVPVAACSNYKRFVVLAIPDDYIFPDQDTAAKIPLIDFLNSNPKMYRVDVTKGSFTNLSVLVEKLKHRRISSNFMVIRITFDNSIRYTPLVFTPIILQTEEEAKKILEIKDNPEIQKTLMAEMVVPEKEEKVTQQQVEVEKKIKPIQEEEIVTDFTALAGEL